MAYGRKTGGRDFQKGHKGYGKPLSHEARELRKMTLREFVEAAREILHMNPEQAKTLALNPDTPYYKRIILKVVGKGDFREIEVLFNRLFGKVSESIKLDADVTSQNLFNPEQLKKMAQIIVDNEQSK